METVNEPVMLMELERELAGPDKLAALARNDKILADLAARIDFALKQGVAPEEFQRIEKLKEANILARKILRLTVRVDG